MPRERTTWNRDDIAKTAGLKVADPYTMNQDHVKQQPAVDAYTIGDPSAFAEDVHPSNGTWEAEYSGGQVKRNEIGMPEFRGDTFNHAEKTASDEVITKKAALCVAIARSILPKTASALEIEDQSLSFMNLPDADVMATYTRLAKEEDKEAEETDDGQDKEAGKIPPQFLENVKKKKEEAKDKADDQGQQKQAQQDQGQQDQGQQKQAQQGQQDQGQQDQGQQKQAQQDQGQQDQGQQKQAQQDQIAQLQNQAQQIQQQIAQLQAQQAQGQQVQSQAQQIAQAVQQALAAGQDPSQAVAQFLQQQGGCQQAQQQAPIGQDAELIDAMLAQDQLQAPTAEMDIQIDTPTMDVGEAQLGPEDDVLRQLFAGHAEVRAAQQALGEDPDQDQGQQKQAHVVRTASTRTVGTRPTAGVSQIGGSPSTANGGDKLAGLWNSAPDVREAFGLPTNR